MALTEKGTVALNLIFNLYQEGNSFTAKELSVKANTAIVGITLNSLANDGYLSIQKGSPNKYTLLPGAKASYEQRKPKDYQEYSKKEFEKQKTMSYQELCNYLTNKYGIVDGPYFCNENCKGQNNKIRRKGLIIHHIKEDTHIMLCNHDWAIQHSFELQQGYNLVYCNIIEHLLLHMKITIEFSLTNYEMELPGVGGVINFILPSLYNDYQETKYICNISKEDIDQLVKEFDKQYKKSDMNKLYPYEQMRKDRSSQIMLKSSGLLDLLRKK